ncbi:hypothetical protein CAOG_00615 [Capsaspora owczarzaki ATCC 30864]|uniref:Condensation domain-containing protein n=1 Tax=Capsaspora owczarzaki (strain ATCC 30864) TaxID=595528 RepID=A0A0D2X0H4_CAPO3|nr:hypothetical protein CAOG_00615 [Capsaspora owczarzaki ATCC 30864]KJE89064.1 hypothetical protein CAOG_000615 [Capsaspora owczarzaki ATCC 30864]|eukprot:XP_004365486.1 hypothetical protein CAOG_00615 [Capsaspora owczarzaki ATCC 30864]
MLQTPRLRDLGNLERWAVARQLSKVYSSFSMCGEVELDETALLRREPSTDDAASARTVAIQQAVRTGIRSICNIHPMLNMALVDAAGVPPGFVALPDAAELVPCDVHCSSLHSGRNSTVATAPGNPETDASGRFTTATAAATAAVSSSLSSTTTGLSVETTPAQFPPLLSTLNHDAPLWLTLLRNEGANSFKMHDPTLPLWRVIVTVDDDAAPPSSKVACVAEESSASESHRVVRCHVIVTFHHTIADGLSGVIVMRDLMDAVAAYLEGGVHPATTADPVSQPALQPLPSVDSLVDITPTAYTLVSAVVQKLLLPRVIQQWLFAPNFYVGEQRLELEQLRNPPQHQLTLAAIPPELTKQLVNAARQHNTTVHAVVMTAANFAFYGSREQSHTAAAAAPLTTQIGSASSLRNDSSSVSRLPAGFDFANAVGYFVCGIETRHTTLPQSSFWTEAQSARAELTKGLHPAKQTLGLLGFLKGDWTDYIESHMTVMPNGKASTCSISNLGRAETIMGNSKASTKGCSGSKSHNVRLKTLTFSQSYDLISSLGNVNVITLNDTMHISMAYSHHLLPHAQLERWWPIFLSSLQLCVSRSSLTLEEVLAAVRRAA